MGLQRLELRKGTDSNVKEMLGSFILELLVFDTQRIRLEDIARLAIPLEHRVVHNIAQI